MISHDNWVFFNMASTTKCKMRSMNLPTSMGSFVLLLVALIFQLQYLSLYIYSSIVLEIESYPENL